MKKYRIRRKHKTIIKWLTIALVISLFVTLTLLVINGFRTEKQENEDLLLSEEKNTYEKRLQVAKSINDIFNYSLNGYEKINESQLVRTLIISDTTISKYSKYQIKPQWQPEFEQSMNQMNNQKNHFSNILLRGSNIMWAYMQVSSDLTKNDFDFAIIQISEHDIKQLKVEEFTLYYEALLRQLYTQFLDIKVYVVLNDEVFESLDTMETSKYNTIKKQLQIINEDYDIHTLIVDQVAHINTSIKQKFTVDLQLQKENKNSITKNNLHSIDRVSHELFEVERLNSSSAPTKVEGFMIKKGLLFNHSSTNSIEYEVEEPFIFLNYVTFIDGCDFEVYIDDKLYNTFNSYSEVTGVGVLTLPTSNKKRTIKIVAISEPNKGTYLMMDNLLVGYKQK